jgi:hypothetical protein
MLHRAVYIPLCTAVQDLKLYVSHKANPPSNIRAGMSDASVVNCEH